MGKISVLMASKNGEKTIANAIESILNQSFQDFEFIICDDYSTDSTHAIIENYQKKDSRIKLIMNNRAPGFTNALNAGLDHCSGDYIARMDDDDSSHVNRLKVEYEYLNSHPHVSIVGSNANFFDNSGIYGTTEKKEILNSKDIWRGDIFIHPTVMFRRQDQQSIGNYNTNDEVIRIEDYDFWCKFYANGLFGVNIQEPLVDYREDKNSFAKRDIARRFRLVKCMRKWRRSMNIPPFFAVFELYELFKIFVPQSLIQKYHRIKYGRNKNNAITNSH